MSGAKPSEGRLAGLSPRGLWLVAVLAAAGAIAVAVGAGSLLAQRFSLWTGWSPVLLAAGVVVLVPAVGLWPLASCDPTDTKRISKAAYAGTPIRMVTAGVLGLFVLLSLPDKPVRVSFGLWLAGLYMVSLVTETVVLAVWLTARTPRARV